MSMEFREGVEGELQRHLSFLKSIFNDGHFPDLNHNNYASKCPIFPSPLATFVGETAPTTRDPLCPVACLLSDNKSPSRGDKVWNGRFTGTKWWGRSGNWAYKMKSSRAHAKLWSFWWLSANWNAAGRLNMRLRNSYFQGSRSRFIFLYIKYAHSTIKQFWPVSSSQSWMNRFINNIGEIGQSSPIQSNWPPPPRPDGLTMSSREANWLICPGTWPISAIVGSNKFATFSSKFLHIMLIHGKYLSTQVRSPPTVYLAPLNPRQGRQKKEPRGQKKVSANKLWNWTQRKGEHQEKVLTIKKKDLKKISKKWVNLLTHGWHLKANKGATRITW